MRPALATDFRQLQMPLPLSQPQLSCNGSRWLSLPWCRSRHAVLESQHWLVLPRCPLPCSLHGQAICVHFRWAWTCPHLHIVVSTGGRMCAREPPRMYVTLLRNSSPRIGSPACHRVPSGPLPHTLLRVVPVQCHRQGPKPSWKKDAAGLWTPYTEPDMSLPSSSRSMPSRPPRPAKA